MLHPRPFGGAIERVSQSTYLWSNNHTMRNEHGIVSMPDNAFIVGSLFRFLIYDVPRGVAAKSAKKGEQPMQQGAKPM